MKKKKELSTDEIFDLLTKEVSSVIKENPTTEVIRAQWKYAFIKILRKSYGFNKVAAKEMFKWGEYGHNWKALHFDMTTSKEKVLKNLLSEISYISDRLSLDRLLRTHHIYQHYMALYRFEIQLKEMSDEEKMNYREAILEESSCS